MIRVWMGAAAVLAACCLGCAPRPAESELAFGLSSSQRAYRLGEPIVVTVAVTNRSDMAIEETWTALCRVLMLKLSTGGRELILHRFADLPSVGSGQGRISIPPGRTLLYSFVLNFPGEPLQGAASALGYSDPDSGGWRGELPPGKYVLRARLNLAARRAQVAEELWMTFAREQAIRDTAKATAEQMGRFAKLLDEHLAAMKSAGTGAEYDASAAFEVAPGDARSGDAQRHFRTAVVACAREDGAGRDAALKELEEMLGKVTGDRWEPWVLYSMGRVLALHKKPKEAIRQLDRVATRVEKGSYLHGRQLVLRKTCLEDLGAAKQAETVDASIEELFGTAAVFAGGAIELRGHAGTSGRARSGKH